MYSMVICITVDGLKWQIEEADGLHGYYGFTKTIFALSFLFFLKGSSYFFP